MHRLIIGAREGEYVDHINGNGLDNRRSNLRIATAMTNQQNRKLQKNNKSGYKGVSWDNTNRAWICQIRVNKRSKFLGYFKDAQEAGKAYDVAAEKYFGKFAKLNINL